MGPILAPVANVLARDTDRCQCHKRARPQADARAKPAPNNTYAAGTLLARLLMVLMSHMHVSIPRDVIIPEPLDSVDDRERRLIEAVVALARSLRDERDRLAWRLREVERELSLLISKLDAPGETADEEFVSDLGTAAPADPPRRPR